MTMKLFKTWNKASRSTNQAIRQLWVRRNLFHLNLTVFRIS